MKVGAAGQRNTETGWVYVLASTFRQVREQVRYTARAKGNSMFREHTRQGLSGFPKMEIRAKIY